MGIVCPSCETEPPTDATAGGPCVNCGARLVLVDRTDDLIGTVVDDRFEILGRLGAGGMGVVYRARQRSVDREIAFKVLDRRVEQDVASVKRFFREAKLASTLAHPNTVQIIDFGQSRDLRLYIAMELVRGHDLLVEMNEVGALPASRVIAIGIQLCDALEVAHGLQIVHRDLKPENVMLVDGGRDQIKILDFGLARSLTDPGTRATATGLISGTPRYMPPEVALEGADPDPAQDMYAVGVILGELLIGRALWAAPTIAALFTQKLDISEATASIPLPFRALVGSLLQTVPSQRPTAAQARAALLQIQGGSARRGLEQQPTAAIAVVAPEPGPSLGALETLGSLNDLRLMSISDVTAPPARASAPSLVDPTITSPPPVMEAGPPPAPEPAALELDPEWRAGRAAVRGAKDGAPQAPIAGGRPSSGGRGVSGVLVLAFVVAAGAGGLWYYKHHGQAPSQPPVYKGSGVEIVITASDPVAVEIDGHKAGTTPLRLKLTKRATPMMISGASGVTEQVIPDHDQVIDLTPK